MTTGNELNPWDYADYSEDLVPESEYEEAFKNQYIYPEVDVTISDEAQKAIQLSGEPSSIAKEATDFGLTFLDQVTVYHNKNETGSTNPLLGQEPYRLDDASFVYWCYQKAGLELFSFSNNLHKTQIKSSLEVTTIGEVGSGITAADLVYGDIVFFSYDRLVGLYVGNSEFIAFTGGGYNNYSGGLRKYSMARGKWFTLFQGHVLRHIS